MKAVEYQKYGSADVFQLSEIAQPTPKAGEVLIQVHATTVTAADIMMRTGRPLIGRLFLGLRRPKKPVLGFEFAGVVMGLGADVSNFKIGDRVFGGTMTMGAYAQYVCVKATDVLTKMPDNLSFEEAAPVAGSAITALNFLQRLANIQPGQKVLINGAAGGVGTYAMQIAKLLGAEVTGVCSAHNMQRVRDLGADFVMDYAQQDFAKNGQQYDVIFDTVSKRSFSECKNALTQNGIYMPTVVNGTVMRQMLWGKLFGGKKVMSSSTGLLPVKERLGYLRALKELLAEGKLKTVIDRRYALAEMAAAHVYVEAGHKVGAVVVLPG
jgi:NADPH:quinone reductase-like Zn-dependent oxidoreductase